LTTSFAVDILGVQHMEPGIAERKRKYTHIGMSIVFILIMLIFKALNNKSIIDAIYTIVSYTYGPLLGMFTFGLFTRRKVRDKWVPIVAVASPFICYGLNSVSTNLFRYPLGYELLMINGLITFTGMYLLSINRGKVELIN